MQRNHAQEAMPHWQAVGSTLKDLCALPLQKSPLNESLTPLDLYRLIKGPLPLDDATKLPQVVPSRFTPSSLKIP